MCTASRPSVGGRLNEVRVIEENSNLVDHRSRWSHRLSSSLDVLAILPATGIRAEPRQHESKHSLDFDVDHRLDRLGQQWAPVAIPPEDRQVDAATNQLRPQNLNQVAHLLVDRADAAETLVVLGDFQQPLARHRFAASHVFEKRHDLVRPFGAAEANNQQSIVRSRHQSSRLKRCKENVALSLRERKAVRRSGSGCG